MTIKIICAALVVAVNVYVGVSLVVIWRGWHKLLHRWMNAQDLFDAALLERIDALEKRVALLERAEPAPAPDPDAATISPQSPAPRPPTR